MNKLFSSLSMLLFYGAAAFGGTLNVSASATSSAGLYSYSYTFNITGTGSGFDNIFLGSDDLSPLNLQMTLNGAGTSDWSYLGNDTPQNYLQFYSQSNTPLGIGSNLGVSFLSSFRPANSHFAIGLNSATNSQSNQVTGVLAPTAVPEPASAAGVLLAACLALGCFAAKRINPGSTART